MKRAWCALFRPRLERCQRTSRLDFGFLSRGGGCREAAGQTGARGARLSREDARDTPGSGFAGKRVELAACETRLRARERDAGVSAYKDAKLRRRGRAKERVSEARRGWKGAGERRGPRVERNSHGANLRAETRTVRCGAARPPDVNSVTPGASHHLSSVTSTDTSHARAATSLRGVTVERSRRWKRRPTAWKTRGSRASERSRSSHADDTRRVK